MDSALEIIRKAEYNFSIAPIDLTGSSFLDYLSSEDTAKRKHLPNGHIYQYHSALLAIPELGTMVRDYDMPFLSILSYIWDNPEIYDQRRRSTRDEPLIIPHPNITILAGTQPGYLASVLPPDAWTQGFMARVMLIHSAEIIKPKLFGARRPDEEMSLLLAKDLNSLSTLHGEFHFSEPAQTLLEAWHDSDYEPKPKAHRLEAYNVRRHVQLQKLALISAASRHTNYIIEEYDLRRAMRWLLDAEASMENIFLEMLGKSDHDVIRDLHSYAWRAYLSRSSKPLHKSFMLSFLQARTPIYKVEKIWDMCLKSNLFANVAGKDDYYIPLPPDYEEEE